LHHRVEDVGSRQYIGAVWSVFRPGVEYIYRYESEALTGIRTVSDQLTGIKVRADVKVQIHHDGTSLIKVCSST